MVIVAAFVSRVEALVVASMLQAAGIDVCVGAAAHTGVAVNSLALGGHRLWIPATQHCAASQVILEVLGTDEWGFSYGLQKAVLRLMAFWVIPFTAMGVVGVWSGALPVSALLLAPLSGITVPVNPQGRGDFYLVAAED